MPNRYETLPGGGAEQDLARTWVDTATTLRQLADKVPDLATRTIAIAVTGQGDGTWLIDKDGEPVAKGWLWLDRRKTTRFKIDKDGLVAAAERDGKPAVWVSLADVEREPEADAQVFWATPGTS